MNNLSGIDLIGNLHGRFVHRRRISILAQSLAVYLRPGCSLLDVGCGDGQLAMLLDQSVPGMKVQGVEVLPRPDCAIECRSFDGCHLPFPDASFDACLFSDVLHHTQNPLAILQDAFRVSREFILIKDHLAETSFDRLTLRLMDWVGNRPHGVAMTYRYFSRTDWDEHFRKVSLIPVKLESTLPLYPFPFSILFGRNLHFVALLRKQA
jgi:SAM-dependent methyltransferase